MGAAAVLAPVEVEVGAAGEAAAEVAAAVVVVALLPELLPQPEAVRAIARTTPVDSCSRLFVSEIT